MNVYQFNLNILMIYLIFIIYFYSTINNFKINGNHLDSGM